MSKTNKFSKNAFEFSLTAELQRRLAPYGPSVVSEKNRMYYRTAIAYGSLPPWQESEYDNAASVVADAITKMATNIFCAKSDQYTFSHPIVMMKGNTDRRDIVIDDNSGVNIGVYIGSSPDAWLENAFLYSVEEDGNSIVDIGNEWFGSVGISDNYVKALETVQDRLRVLEGKPWNDAYPFDEVKFQELYYPLLDAIINESKLQCSNGVATKTFVKKLFGEKDYYLVTLNSQAKKARVSAYDVNGNLGFGQKYVDELLPTKLIRAGYKERTNSIANSIITLTFDRGWIANIRLKQEGKGVKAIGPRLGVDFNGSNPHNLIQAEVHWK